MTVFNYTISTFAHNITAKARNGSQSGATRCHAPCFMTLMTTIKKRKKEKEQTGKQQKRLQSLLITALIVSYL